VTIIEQQVRLELGENYDRYVVRAQRFLKTRLNSPQLAGSKQRILNNEGDGKFDQVVQQLLLTIVEKGDINSAFDSYGQYLEAEYNVTNNRSTTHHTKWVLLGDNLPANGGPVPDGIPEAQLSSPLKPLQAKCPHVIPCFKSDEERELMQIMGDFGFGESTGDRGRQPTYGRLQEVFTILGWDRQKGMRIYHRIKARKRRFEETILETPPDLPGTP